jgi:crotonobetainyl-CoA:carnitine CoA-transferase CaiB-like acyl-CoA transferase
VSVPVTAGASLDGPLTGLSILDFAQSLSGAFCTATLERMGAQVTRVDLGGSPATETAFLDAYLSDSPIYRDYLRRAAPRRHLDLDVEADVDAFRDLVASVDVVVEDMREPLLAMVGIDVTTLESARPTPIVVSITPHGRTGPRSSDLASDLTIFHGGGPGHGVPGLVADPVTMSPLRLGGHQGSFVSGLVAAINVCAAVHARRRSPAGARVEVDVSCHEALANSYRQSLGTFAFYGGGMNRDAARGRGAGGTIDHRNLRCKDGYFNIAWGGVQQWDSLKELLGNPEWTDDPDLATPPKRYRNWIKIVPRLETWAAEFDREQLFYMCQGWRIPCAPVHDGGDLLNEDVLTGRDFWQPTVVGDREVPMPGSPSRRSTASPTAEAKLE